MDRINPTQVVEFQVRPVTRYLVTRYEPEGRGSTLVGEFHHAHVAEQVGLAMKAVTPDGRFYSMVDPQHNEPGALQARGLLERRSPGDTIIVEGKSASIWAVHEWDGQRIFDVIFSDDTPPARVVDVLPYKRSLEAPRDTLDLSASPLPAVTDSAVPQYSSSKPAYVDTFTLKYRDRVIVDGMSGWVSEIHQGMENVRELVVWFDHAQRHPATVQENLNDPSGPAE